MNTFYMVYVQDGNAPTYKHPTLESAEQEAKRLTQLLNKPAYVLCSIKCIELNVYNITDLRPDQLLPF